jgi:hypothetical protein
MPKLRSQKGHYDWKRVGQSGPFDDHVIDLLVPFQHSTDRIHQIVIDRAADTTIAELDHVLVGGDYQLAVDPDLADVVDDNRDLEPIWLARIWSGSVVFLLPRKPVTTVTGKPALPSPSGGRDPSKTTVMPVPQLQTARVANCEGTKALPARVARVNQCNGR